MSSKSNYYKIQVICNCSQFYHIMVLSFEDSVNQLVVKK